MFYSFDSDASLGLSLAWTLMRNNQGECLWNVLQTQVWQLTRCWCYSRLLCRVASRFTFTRCCEVQIFVPQTRFGFGWKLQISLHIDNPSRATFTQLEARSLLLSRPKVVKSVIFASLFRLFNWIFNKFRVELWSGSFGALEAPTHKSWPFSVLWPHHDCFNDASSRVFF